VQQQALGVLNRVLRLFQRIDPRRFELGPDELVHHRVAQFLLAGEMVKERPLGQPGLLDDAVQATALKAVAVELLKGSPKNQLSCRFRRVRFFHIVIIPTSWYVVKGFSSRRASSIDVNSLEHDRLTGPPFPRVGARENAFLKRSRPSRWHV